MGLGVQSIFPIGSNLKSLTWAKETHLLQRVTKPGFLFDFGFQCKDCAALPFKQRVRENIFGRVGVKPGFQV